MKTAVILIKNLWQPLFSVKKTTICIVSLVLLITGAAAQEIGIYDIISTTGTIVDKTSGKTLQEGDRINLQTELQFNSLNDRAIVMSPSKSKYFLELPKSSFVNQQLTVNSNQALAQVKARPALITGVRGGSILTAYGLSPETLKEYLTGKKALQGSLQKESSGVDTFTIIGSKIMLPVTKGDAGKYDLLLRYENGMNIEEYLSTDFSIVKSDLKLQGNRIIECYVLLKEGDRTIPVTQLSLFFVEKMQLFNEFNSLLKALNQKKDDKNAVRIVLRQYCTDVYGMIDNDILKSTIDDYLK